MNGSLHEFLPPTLDNADIEDLQLQRDRLGLRPTDLFLLCSDKWNVAIQARCSTHGIFSMMMDNVSFLAHRLYAPICHGINPFNVAPAGRVCCLIDSCRILGQASRRRLRVRCVQSSSANHTEMPT